MSERFIFIHYQTTECDDMSLKPTLSINGYPAINPTDAKVPSRLATAWCYFINILGGRSYSTRFYSLPGYI